jgi:hypothetical protein
MRSRNELPALFEKFRVTGIGAEIGVMKGIFSRIILSEYHGKLLLVDSWVNGGFPNVLHLMEETNRVMIRRGDSVAVSKTVDDESLDFVYIDADHTYQGCLLDIIAWESKVRVGGLICGHDFADYPEERIMVKKAVRKYYGNDVMVTTDDEWNGKMYNSWYLVKR